MAVQIDQVVARYDMTVQLCRPVNLVAWAVLRLMYKTPSESAFLMHLRNNRLPIGAPPAEKSSVFDRSRN